MLAVKFQSLMQNEEEDFDANTVEKTTKGVEKDKSKDSSKSKDSEGEM